MLTNDNTIGGDLAWNAADSYRPCDYYCGAIGF